ncbi:MAG: hypothetical protein JW839_09275 [Candidatus Lokiarchaeota archaeon]|nr:hypothetical protein [Candidatus Lokiarchaeota archaeon]
MTAEKPSIILADWNEERGPLIIDSIFPEQIGDVDDSPEVLVTRCYINAQSIFARADFSKINFSVPMVSIKKLAVVFFDVIPDEKVRGGKRPFILVVFVPIEMSYSIIERIAKVVDPFLDVYKRETIPELFVLQDQIAAALSEGTRSNVAEEPAARVAAPPTNVSSGQAPRAARPAKPAVRVRTSFDVQPSEERVDLPAVQQAPSTPAYRPKQAPPPNEGDATSIPGLRKFSTLKFPARSGGGARDTDPALTPEQQDLLEKVKAKGWVLKSWNPEDIERLKQMVAAGKEEREIAAELHRELKQVQKKIEELKR